MRPESHAQCDGKPLNERGADVYLQTLHRVPTAVRRQQIQCSPGPVGVSGAASATRVPIEQGQQRRVALENCEDLLK